MPILKFATFTFCMFFNIMHVTQASVHTVMAAPVGIEQLHLGEFPKYS